MLDVATVYIELPSCREADRPTVTLRAQTYNRSERRTALASRVGSRCPCLEVGRPMVTLREPTYNLSERRTALAGRVGSRCPCRGGPPYGQP